VSDWRPIETAPKDGEEVILWLPEIPNKQIPRWIVSKWAPYWNCWMNEYSNGPAYNTVSKKHPAGYMTSDFQQVAPSHWMPSPKKPEGLP